MPSEKPLKLDPNSFHELEPVEQGLALLALIFMDEMGLTLEDVVEDNRDAKEW